MLNNEETNRKSIIKFAILSLLGVIIFLLPVYDPNREAYSLLVGMIGEVFPKLFFGYEEWFVATTMTISVIGAAIYAIVHRKKNIEDGFLKDTFKTGPVGFLIRIAGCGFYLMVLFQIGPEWLIGPDVGGTLRPLILTCGVSLIPIFILTPFLMDFGLMDFIGTLLSKFTRPIFKLPGRASVDMLTSWVGTVSVGLVVTEKQYVEGYYNKREATIIATCFTASGVAFWIVCDDTIGIGDYLPQFFASTFIVGFAAAAIMARIPPFSRIPNEYNVINENNEDPINCKPANMSLFKYAVSNGTIKCDNTGNVGKLFFNAAVMSISRAMVLPASVMTIGGVGLLLSETPVFEILGTPFGWLLSLLQVPEASEAGTALMSGLADMFLPFIFGGSISSLYTKFIVGLVGLTQIIYLSEVVGFIAASKLPISVGRCIIIFFEKTFICIPLAVLCALVFQIPM